MAPTPTLNNGNSSNPASNSDRNTHDLAGERRNKRRAEDGPPALSARSLGGLWAHSDPLLNKPFYPN
ncbi:unnamed protein product, partial [Closterium sp. NIES-54]